MPLFSPFSDRLEETDFEPLEEQGGFSPHGSVPPGKGLGPGV